MLRIYRNLPGGAKPPRGQGKVWTLDDLQREGGLPPEFCERGYSLLPFSEMALLCKFQREHLHDLGSLIWRADLDRPRELMWKRSHRLAVATTLLCLAREGMERGWEIEVCIGLAHRALWLLNFGNPWEMRFGDFKRPLTEALEILLSLCNLKFDKNRETSTSHIFESASEYYYKALSFWYKCSDRTPQEVRSYLEQMLKVLRNHLSHKKPVPGESASLQKIEHNAEALRRVAETALYPTGALSEVIEEDPKEVWASLSQIQRIAADQTSETPLFSPPFLRAWKDLLSLREHRQKIQWASNPESVRDQLKKHLREVERKKRDIFALPNETAVLHLLYNHELTVLMEIIGTSGVSFQISPQKDWLDFGEVVKLSFDVTNTGREIAQDVELLLEDNPTFQLKSDSPIRSLPTLLPGESTTVTYEVMVNQLSDVDFEFSYVSPGPVVPPPIKLPVRHIESREVIIRGDPYVFGDPITDPVKFYGREKEIRKILAILAGGGQRTFLLLGARRMGKSSILYMLEQLLFPPPEEVGIRLRRRFNLPDNWDEVLNRCVAVPIDLQGVPFLSAADFTARFFRVVLENVYAKVDQKQAEKALATYDVQSQPGKQGPALALLGQLAELFQLHKQTRVLILLDELDEVSKQLSEEFLGYLRSVMNKEQRLVWVVSSTFLVYRQIERSGSPWYNIVEIVPVGIFPSATARKLVWELSESVEVFWQTDAIESALRETGCHPAFLQLFCSAAIGGLIEDPRKKNKIVPEYLKDLPREMIKKGSTLDGQFASFWNMTTRSKKTPGIGMLILLAVQESDETLTQLGIKIRVQKWLEEAGLGGLIKQMVPNESGNQILWLDLAFQRGMDWETIAMDMIQWDQTSQTYRFTVPLFRRWLGGRVREGRSLKEHQPLEEAIEAVREELRRDGII